MNELDKEQLTISNICIEDLLHKVQLAFLKMNGKIELPSNIFNPWADQLINIQKTIIHEREHLFYLLERFENLRMFGRDRKADRGEK